MAEGHLQPRKGKRLEDVGEEYLNALISRSFFQQNCRGDESVLTMHDLMHDLATHIAGEFSFLYGSPDDLNNLTSKTHYFSYMKDCKDKIEYETLSKAKHLRSLLPIPLSCDYRSFEPVLTENVLNELLQRAGGCLRALSLSQSSITQLHEAIGRLKYLRYLDVSGTRITKLPSSICTLYNLQALLLSSCNELTQLPTNISNLINLRHLMIRDTSLKEMPPHMCNMINLQTLSDFVLSENNGSRIKELGPLQLFHGSLCISGLENVKDVGDVLKGNLKNKKFLCELILRWDGEADDSTKEREILNALQPHVNVKKLEIIGYGGTVLPNWVSHSSYRNLAEISLSNFANCCLLPSFKEPGSLRKLQIRRLDAFVGVHDELCATSLVKPFQLLVVLELSGLNMWDWPFIDGGDQEGNIFPCLKRFSLQNCRKLSVGLPAGYLPSLENVIILKCDDMVSTAQHIDAAYPSLETLRVASCSRLEFFSGTGLPSSLNTLHIHDCDALFSNRIEWNLQRASSLERLFVFGPFFNRREAMVHSFPEEGLLPTTLKDLTVAFFGNLQALNGKGFRHLASFRRLVITDCYKLQSLPAEGLPRTLTSLVINECPWLSGRCQRGTGEDWPKIQHIPQIQIDRKEI